MLNSNELINKVKVYNKFLNHERLDKAYNFAIKAHQNQKRASGDPYSVHPIEVANILTELKLDSATITTGLLHDTIEDTVATYETIKNEFGPEVADLVDGVTKISVFENTASFNSKAENFRKLILATSKDIRVLLVKIADRLHNMRTIKAITKEDKRKRIAQETMEIYAPLADRMGMHRIRDELEDLSFEILNNDARKLIKKRLDEIKLDKKNLFEELSFELSSILNENHINADIYGREKTPFSIWRKVVDAPVDLWDYIETVPWHGMDPYAAVVPTLGDSSMNEMHMSTFMVTAHTEDVDFWIDSEPMSGYSVDNLVPTAPMSLAFVSSPGSVTLSWSGPVDEDFNYFNVYRQDILTDEPAMIFTTTDSFFVDQQLEDVGAFEYWITAVDLSGLESESSGLVSAVLSTKDELGLPTEFALKQNYPNPFNPSTQIQYALPNESSVVISIYDITGRLVRTLVNEFQSPGYRTITWNATNDMGRPVSAGMYIYSIHAGDFIQNRKMILMK